MIVDRAAQHGHFGGALPGAKTVEHGVGVFHDEAGVSLSETAHEVRAARQGVGRGRVRRGEVTQRIEGEPRRRQRVELRRERVDGAGRYPRSARHLGRVGREAVVEGAPRIPGGGVERGTRLSPANHHHQRRVGLEKAGEIAERGKLHEPLGRHRRPSAEGDDHTAVQARRQRIAAGSVLGGGDGLSDEGGRAAEGEEQQGKQAHGGPVYR